MMHLHAMVNMYIERLMDENMDKFNSETVYVANVLHTAIGHYNNYNICSYVWGWA